jgi:hypothetical protein
VKWLPLVLLLLSASAFAEIGNVVDVTGTAIIKRGGASLPVAKGTPIELNDKVETKNGVVNIKFKDDTTVKVTESSALLIDDFVYDPKSGAGKLGLKAAAGTVRYVSGNIAHNNPNSVKINTPTAAIAVRGTDFVMAVDETGKSAIILMPTCEVEHNVNLKGLSCGSGAIDVETGGGIVKMNRPYQATVVETGNAAPLPPIIVELGGAAIGNNLMISPLKTASGLTIQQAARAAAEKTGDAKKRDGADKKDDDKKDDKSPSLVEQVAINSGNEEQKKRVIDEQTQSGIISIDSLKEAGIDVKDATTGDMHVYQAWKDASKTQQIGWGYESLSQNGRNYANIVMTMDTKAIVIVTQDRQTEAYNFNANSSKAYGSIVINQTWK